MTESDVAALSKELAAVVRTVVKDALAPLDGRVAALEVRDETTTAALAEARTAVQGYAAELASVRERVAVVEVREPQPGPPGPEGPAGRDGKDGTPGLRYCGVWVEGKAYGPGDCATWAGSMWHCNEATSSRPGEASKLWTMMVKAGRDVGRNTREADKWRS